VRIDPLRDRRLKWVTWGLAIAVVTLVLFAFRQRLDKAHIALLYLLVILAGSSIAGRAIGLALAGVAFLLFDLVFLPPYGTLVVADPFDWLVLVAFVLVSVVVAQILHRLQREASDARARATEVGRLAELGAETLNVARADDALTTVLGIIRSTLRVDVCRVHPPRPAAGAPEQGVDSLVRWVIFEGRTALRLTDGGTHLTPTPGVPVTGLGAARALFLPLQVRNRTVGVLELASEPRLELSATHHHYLTALSYYAALAVDRGRLESEARMVDAYREADRLKDALLASVSHDLRTPLTTIKALAHDLAPVDDRALVIEEEADRLNRMVANLLDFSRLQAGALSLAIDLNAVDDVLGALAQRMEPTLHARPLVIRLENQDTLLVGRFDFAQTLRILGNLVENAHKYAPPGTPVEVIAGRRGAEIEITVSDHGPGIEPTERDRVFQPFYRAPSTAPDTGGAGLGLAIARQLAELQGGSLRYEPRAGGGSLFRLAFPAADLPTVPSAI
jgi:two-component system sensor histidine kinase KdpD